LKKEPTRWLADFFKDIVRRYLAEARRTLPDSQFEIIFVGKDKPKEKLDKNCRFLGFPKLGYYGWKNQGAIAARGRYLIYLDSDCRVEPGYLKRALKTFKNNPDVIGLGGLTIYDGNTFFGRVNTVLSFGPHFKSPIRYTRLSVITNNVCLLKNAFPRRPFGPYTGRTGGDYFITQYAVKIGKPFLQVRGLKSYHEDQTQNLKTLLERTLRDLFQPVLTVKPSGKWATWRTALFNCPLLLMKRSRRVLLFGRATGLSWLEMICSPIFLGYLTLVELAALSTMAVRPSLLMRWLNFQFGTNWVKKSGTH